MHVAAMLVKTGCETPTLGGERYCLPLVLGGMRVKIASIGRFLNIMLILAGIFSGACGGHLRKKWYNTPRACS